MFPFLLLPYEYKIDYCGNLEGGSLMVQGKIQLVSLEATVTRLRVMC